MNCVNIKDAENLCSEKYDTKISYVFKSSEMKRSFTELAQQYKIKLKI